MIDAAQSCVLADQGSVLPRERAPVVPTSLLGLARAILEALRESRRREAQAVLRQHHHLVRHAGAHALGADLPAPRADGDER